MSLKRIIDVHVGSKANPQHGHGLGDAILMLPVIAGVAAANPDAHVRAVVVDKCVPWVNLGWPHTVAIKLGEPVPLFHNEVWPQLHESLAGDKRAIDQGLCRLELWARDAGVLPKRDLKPIISDEARAWADDILKRYFFGHKVVWLSPWACGAERNWPARRWAELIDGLLCAGYTMAGIRQSGGHFFDGVTWFEDSSFPADRTAAMFERAALVIGNDSGMVHLAGFLGVPALAICGPTVGSCVFGNYPSVRIAQAPMFCNGCMGMTHHYNPRWCRLSCDALTNFQAPDVLKVALDMLKIGDPYTGTIKPS